MSRTTQEYMVAFAKGVFADGTKLEPPKTSYTAQECAVTKAQLSVRPEVKLFILNFIDSQPDKQARSLDIGKRAFRTPGMTRRLLGPDDEDLINSKYTAWAGMYCKRLMIQGYLLKTEVPLACGPRKTTIVYSLTLSGKQWLADNSDD